MQRKIIHCDCDCFFAAVEMRDNPELAKVPLAVGGSVERRGVISTCNYLAREYGINSAMATAQALKLCPDLVLVSGNMAKYREVSQQVMDIFRDYTDLIEPLSLDEAYLDVSESHQCQGSATLIAREIRQRVREEVGITISAGVAPNKFLAKVASDWEKPDGLFVVKPQDAEGFVAQLPVKKISGVGEKTAEKLKRIGIETCADLKMRTLAELVERFGKFGHRLYELSRGIDERPVRTRRQRKSVSVEHTYSQDLPDLEACVAQLPSLMAELEERYAKYREQSRISGVVVKVKFCDFTQTTAEHQVRVVESSHIQQLLSDAYTRGCRPVRLIGVGYRLQVRAGAEPEQLRLLE